MERIGLDNILIVDLYKAIENDDPDVISKGLNREEFEDLVTEYIELEKNNTSILERRKQALQFRLYITIGCLQVLKQEVADEEMLEVLRDNKWKIHRDTYTDDLEVIKKGVNTLSQKLERIKSEEPKKKKANSKASIYDILASMSAGLDGVYLDPKTVTVVEFVAFEKVLDRKAEQYEKLKK